MACLNNSISTAYEFPPQKVSWLKRDLLVFANTIGCVTDELHFLFVSSICLATSWLSQHMNTANICHRNFIPSLQPFQLTRWFYVSLNLSSFRSPFKSIIGICLELMIISLQPSSGTIRRSLTHWSVSVASRKHPEALRLMSAVTWTQSDTSRY